MTPFPSLRHAALIATLLVAVPAVASPAPAGDPDPAERSSQPLGYAVLAVEEEAGVDVSQATAALRRVVDAVRPHLPAATPRDALQAVAAAVPLACPTLVENAGEGLISGALREGRCDCDVLVITYLTVADELGLPLSAVFLPGHALVVWDDGRETIYWETTLPGVKPAWLVEALVPEGADEAYLRPQSRREMIGYVLQIRANYRVGTGELDEALADYARAAQLSPSFVLTFTNRARAHLLTGRYDLALADVNRALRLDPTLADAVYNRGLALIGLGRYADALDALARVTSLQGVMPDVLYAEGLAFVGLGQDGDALDRFDATLDLAPDLLLPYEARGALHQRQGNAAAAQADYTTFVGLAAGTPHESLIPDVQARMARLASR